MEEKQTEKFFAERHDIFRSLFYDIPLPMWVYDLDTFAFLDVNHAAMRHYGYSREKFHAMTIKDIRSPENIPAVLKNIERLGQGISVSGTWRHRKKDGTVIDVELMSAHSPSLANYQEAGQADRFGHCFRGLSFVPCCIT